ncbi:unnamed protein product [Orchesella dallaii]|uniref:Uncharacterized protein n=1 Tax=Orchesella dallaii TaxID=48710 RepID=A0ABP1QMQ5_9HEXA
MKPDMEKLFFSSSKSGSSGKRYCNSKFYLVLWRKRDTKDLGTWVRKKRMEVYNITAQLENCTSTTTITIILWKLLSLFPSLSFGLVCLQAAQLFTSFYIAFSST